jgi:hypothetical protein
LVTITARMFPLLSVTTWLTVPIMVPLLFWTERPVVRPGNAVLDTCPPARTLCELALAIPVVDAWLGPWLTPTAGFVVVLVVVELRFSALFELALSEPWLFTPAFIPALAPPLMPPPGPPP